MRWGGCEWIQACMSLTYAWAKSRAPIVVSDLDRSVMVVALCCYVWLVGEFRNGYGQMLTRFKRGAEIVGAFSKTIIYTSGFQTTRITVARKIIKKSMRRNQAGSIMTFHISRNYLEIDAFMTSG